MNLLDPFFLCLIAMTALAVLGLPIGFAMMAGSTVFLMLSGQDLQHSCGAAPSGPSRQLCSPGDSAVHPFGGADERGQSHNRLLDFSDALVGRFRGGLGHVNVVQSVIFAGMSGSAIADAAGVGRLIMSMMIRENRYTPSYAAAMTAAGAVVGPIIPPSIPMVLFALVSNASIGYLFLGGAVPGLLMAAGLMAMNTLIARRRAFPVETR